LATEVYSLTDQIMDVLPGMKDWWFKRLEKSFTDRCVCVQR